jgi:hypothetical protein
MGIAVPSPKVAHPHELDRLGRRGGSLGASDIRAASFLRMARYPAFCRPNRRIVRLDVLGGCDCATGTGCSGRLPRGTRNAFAGATRCNQNGDKKHRFEQHNSMTLPPALLSFAPFASPCGSWSAIPIEFPHGLTQSHGHSTPMSLLRRSFLRPGHEFHRVSSLVKLSDPTR